MTDAQRDQDLDALGREVMLSVRRLLRERRSGRVEVHVHGPTQHVSQPVLVAQLPDEQRRVA